jgi:ketosteroid isomerase-like protein
MFARNTVTLNGDNGAATTAGRAVTIWRRDGDGEWYCELDIWNAEPPA